MARIDGRQDDELRPVSFERHFTRYAEGAVLATFGNTRVLCTATLEEKVPPFLRGAGKGWVTAEYAMLPRATHIRTPRSAGGNGRSAEIQRLVGRSLRSAVRLDRLGERTIWLDCDVLQADGGTRTTAISGAAILLVFYLLVGGRVFCSWVCPVNVVADAAAWSRRRLGIKTGRAPDSNTRYWLLGGVLIAAAASGALVWEWVNPVTYVQRSLIFGLTGGVWLALGIFLYDLLVAGRGWCGHLCPMGAFYGLLGRTALLRVSAAKRSACNDCMDCFTVCPEPQVIRPALKQVGQQSPIILSGECTACGRCIDVCDLEVFKMTHRFDQRSE